MKRVFAVFAALCAAFAVICGCADKNKTDSPPSFVFPQSAQEEYARAYSVANGKAFDFDNIAEFNMTQTVSVFVPELNSVLDGAGKPAYPTLESREYYFDASERENIRSRVLENRAVFSDRNVAPVYVSELKAFVQNSLYVSSVKFPDFQIPDDLPPVAVWNSFDEYCADSRSFDVALQNIFPYPAELFSTFTGGFSENPDVYGITCEVSSEKYSEFFDLFAEKYSFKSWFAASENSPDDKLYESFLDPLFFESVSVDISTTERGVSTESVTFTALPAPVPFEGLTQRVTVTAITRYSFAEFGK